MPDPVIIFDGDCLFCQRSVRFIHRHDHANVFRFAARQTPVGERLLAEVGVGLAPNSMVLIDDTGTWLRSDAVLRIAARLGAPWSAARIFLAGAPGGPRRGLPCRRGRPPPAVAVSPGVRTARRVLAREDPRLRGRDARRRANW